MSTNTDTKAKATTTERSCTAHPHDGIESETFQRNGVNYIMLRCPTCDRPNGERYIRRSDARHPKATKA